MWFLCPQALDEEYLKVDAQFGGVDQRKIFTLAEKVPSTSVFAHLLVLVLHISNSIQNMISNKIFPLSTCPLLATPSAPIWWTRWCQDWRGPRWAPQKKYVTVKISWDLYEHFLLISAVSRNIISFGCRSQRSTCWTPKKMWRRSWRRLSVSRATSRTTESSPLSNTSSSLYAEVENSPLNLLLLSCLQSSTHIKNDICC